MPAVAGTLAWFLIVASSGPAQTYDGQPLDPSRTGPGVIESLDAVLARDRERPAEPVNPKARNGRHGEWTVPSPHATYSPCSGDHNVVNEWGDTRMGIGWGRPAWVHGAFFSGQAGAGVWARGLRAHGFRYGELVQSTPWLDGLGHQPQWFEMDLYDVDRVVIEARPAFGDSGWYAMDDLTWTPLDEPGAAARVVTFDDCAYGQRLTGSGHAGLDWELGTGPIGLEEGVPAPRISPQVVAEEPTNDSSSGSSGGSQPARGPDGGTLPVLVSEFQGVIRGDAGSLTFPPDTCGAIGPDHFVEAVNRNFAIYEKSTGQELANVLLGSFLPGSNGDPRVLYDQYSGRWIVMVTDFSAEEKIFLAVSLTSDPTGDWFKTDFETDLRSDFNCWPDYPTLGVDAEGIYVAAFMVGCGMTIFAVDKDPLLNRLPALGTVTAFRGLPFESALQPVHCYGVAPGEYFISRESVSLLRLRRLDGPLTAPTLSEAGSVPVPAYTDPLDVPVLGSATPLDTVDARLINAVYRDGSLWTAHTIDNGGRAACRWYEIDAASHSLVQSGTIQDDDLHYFFPGIAVNAAHDVVIGFTAASSGQYASAYYTGRSLNDPPGQMAAPALLRAGQAAQNNIDQFGRNRWGDYSLTTLDPADEYTLWTIQEYAHDVDTWGTWIAALEPVDVCNGVAYCSDLDHNGIRDDACMWWACQTSCTGVAVPFADLGGANGACAPDGAADGNDRFHALNCFANESTLSEPGYPCEPAPPLALNVDAGGPFGSCPPDGICDANDAFHVLHAFAGTTTCSCPSGASGPSPSGSPGPSPSGGPEPDRSWQPEVAATAHLRLVPSAPGIRPGEFVDVDVILNTALPDLRGYQLHLGTRGGQSGSLELVDILIREPVPGFGWSAFNIATHQMLAGLDGPGVAAPSGAHLATFVYRASADAAGPFDVELLYDPADRTQRTFFFATDSGAPFHITAPGARIEVAASLRR